MNSPRMSRVAIAPSRRSRRTTRRASSTAGPAMYRLEKWRTIGLGTAGSRKLTARSRRLMLSRLRAGLDQLEDLSLLGETAQRPLREDELAIHRDLENAAVGR